MKNFILVTLISIMSCRASNQTATNDSNDLHTVVDSIPPCIKTMIKHFQNEEVTNPPRKIFSYTYNNKTVYYVSAVCCDQFSDLYDNDCNLIGHPDGGFTGRGDNKFPDFNKEKTKEKLIWQDARGK